MFQKREQEKASQAVGKANVFQIDEEDGETSFFDDNIANFYIEDQQADDSMNADLHLDYQFSTY